MMHVQTIVRRLSAIDPYRLILALVIAGLVHAGDPPRELPPIVYAPLDKETPLDPRGHGVWLPYERFRQWWERATPEAQTPAQPPLAAALTEATFIGQVEGARARFAVHLTTVAVAEGWSVIELPGDLPFTRLTPADPRVVIQRAASIAVLIQPGDTLSGIAKARLGDGQRWQVIAAANPGLDPQKLVVGSRIIVPLPSERLLVHLPAPGMYVLDGEAAVAIGGEAGAPRRLTLPLPESGAVRAELLIPGPEPTITVGSPGAWSSRRDSDGTRVLIAPRCVRLELGWQPAVTVGGESVLTADTAFVVQIAPRSVRYDLTATIEIARRPVDRLRLAIPAGMQTLGIEGSAVARWEPVDGGIDIILAKPSSGSLTITAHLERAIEIAGTGSRIELTWPTVAGTSRTTGTVALITHDGVRATITATPGLARVDAADLGVAADAAFRFHAQPQPAVLDLALLTPELRAQSASLVRLGAEETTVATRFHLDVRLAGTFSLTIEAPDSWELLDTGGLAVDEVRPLPANGGLAGVRRFELQLRQRLLGEGDLTCRFRAPPGLSATAFTLAPPRLIGARAGRGTVAISAPSAFALQASERSGLVGLDAAEAARQPLLADLVRELGRDEELALAFTWQSTAAESPRARLAASPRPREIAATIEDRITVKDGQVARSATIRGEVRYNPAATLTLILPSAWDELVSVRGQALSERIRGAADPAAATTAWELRFQPPLIGAFQLTIDAAVAAPRLTPGQPAVITVPPLRLEGVGRLTYLAAVARDGAIDLTTSAPGLETMAPADLPAALGQGAVAGFQGNQAVTLSLTATRQDLIALADAGVSRSSWLAVVGEDGVVRLRGRLAAISRGRAQLALALPANATLVEAAVDGRPARASRRDDGAVVLPLPADGGAHSVAVVIEERLAGDVPGWRGSVAIAVPSLATTPGAPPVPVARTEVELRLPARWVVTSWAGDLAAEGSIGATLGLEERDDGLSVPVTASGVSRVAARVGDGGTVMVGVLHQRAQLVLLVLGAGAALLSLWWLWRRPLAALTALAVLAAVCVLAVEAWSAIATATLIGGLAGATGAALTAGIRAWRARRAALHRIEPDPWLEQGGQAP